MLSILSQPVILFFIVLGLFYFVDQFPSVNNEVLDSKIFHLILLVSTIYLANHNISLSIMFLILYLLIKEYNYKIKWQGLFEKVKVNNVVKTKCKIKEVEPSWTVPPVDNSIHEKQHMESFVGKEYCGCGK